MKLGAENLAEDDLFEFFRIEFYRIYRVCRICGKLF